MRLGHLILAAVLSTQCTILSAQLANPVPFIDLPLIPSSRAPGSAGFTLTVNGTNFVTGSVVLWDGMPRETHFISPAKLQAVIPARDIRRACTASLRVRNPRPSGGVSNVALFMIRKSGMPVLHKWRKVVSPPVDVVVAADFNRDGKLDLAATQNYESNTVTIMLGEGGGNFQPAVNYESSGTPGAMAVGDFNNDGNLDLAVANGGILLGRGDGTFYWATTKLLFGAVSVVVGDFNRDGNLDLIYGNNGVYLALGNGDGTFRQPIQVSSEHPNALVAGNFNGDAALDLAFAYDVGGEGRIAVLPGNGDGTFQPPLSVPAKSGTMNMIAADFNGDGKLDLAADNSNEFNPYISVFYGYGDGSFSSPAQLLIKGGAFGLAVGDFDANGRIDIATVDGDLRSLNFVSVLLGDKDGDFLPAKSVRALSPSQGIAAGFFNGHGYLDLVVPTDDGVEILLMQEPYRFDP